MKKNKKGGQARNAKALLATGWTTVEIPWYYYDGGIRREIVHIKYRHPALQPQPVGLLQAMSIMKTNQQLKLQ
jgi:hypothetical protein